MASILKTVLVTKPGFRAGGFSTGLLHILSALDHIIRQQLVPGAPQQLTLTAASNGRHSKTSAHYTPRYEAVDTRTHDFSGTLAKREFIQMVIQALNDGPITNRGPNKFFTENYFAWLENLGKPSEHIHWQVRKGHTIV